jgi:thiamine transport system ATP-binding protein
MLTLEKLVLRLDGFTVTADFKVPQSGITAVLGPSGAGKSTLLSCIAGFLHPASGRILWQGTDITTLPPARRPVSILFQDSNLFPHLTAVQNVGLGLRPDLRLTAEEGERVQVALARVGLEDLGGRKPGQLSGGQAARVALARVLLRDRPLLLLDEPFGALGPALKAEMLTLVRDLAAETGATVLMVSHEPGDARAIAGRVVLVAEGVARAPVATAEIFAHPPAALAAYLG